MSRLFRFLAGAYVVESIYIFYGYINSIGQPGSGIFSPGEDRERWQPVHVLKVPVNG